MRFGWRPLQTKTRHAKNTKPKILASQSRRRHRSGRSDFRRFGSSAAKDKPPDVRQELRLRLGLSLTDSDCGTKRSEARTGGRRSAAHAQGSEVQRSEPDGVRLVLQRAVRVIWQTALHPRPVQKHHRQLASRV